MNTMKQPKTAFTMDLVQSLSTLGWSAFFQTHLENIYDGKLEPARVVGVRKNNFYVSQFVKCFGHVPRFFSEFDHSQGKVPQFESEFIG